MGPRPSIAQIAKADRVGQKVLLQHLHFPPLSNFFFPQPIHIIPTTLDTVSDFGSLRSLLHLKTPLIPF